MVFFFKTHAKMINLESGNTVNCKLIRAVQELRKSADRKLIRSNTDWTHP
jgi:hypothetical protein